MYFFKGGIVVGKATTISNTNGEVTLDNIRLLEHANDNNCLRVTRTTNLKFVSLVLWIGKIGSSLL